jgi:hypothetical protein
MNMKRIVYPPIIAAAAVAVCLAITMPWQSTVVDPSALATWNTFGDLLKCGDLAAAYSLLTTAQQKEHSFEAFTNSAIVGVPSLLDCPVSPYRTRSSQGKTRFVAGTSGLRLPFWLEDGYYVAVVTMHKENGVWRLELPHVRSG